MSFDHNSLVSKSSMLTETLCYLSYDKISNYDTSKEIKSCPEESTWHSGGRLFLSVRGVTTNPQTGELWESFLRRRKSQTGASSYTIPATPS